MPGTNKNTRGALPRRFENYILTRLVDASAGLTNIRDEQFTQAGLAGLGGETISQWNASLVHNGLAVDIPIGFDFEFDGITYKKFAACISGWVVLQDPAVSVFDAHTMLPDNGFGDVYLDQNWQLGFPFSTNITLLAPWFSSITNVCNDASQWGNFGTTKINRINSGLEPSPPNVNATSYGVSYYRDERSHKGRRLIVRWNSVISTAALVPVVTVKFECVLYENGTIEYRYARKSDAPATSGGGGFVGIIPPGNIVNRLRDFSSGLGYRDGERVEYQYGGFEYDPTFFDITTGYASLVDPIKNWPARTNVGCVMTFSPPKQRRKVLTRKLMSILDSQTSMPSVVRNGDPHNGKSHHSFDDRKSVNYNSNVGLRTQVNFPSTLPRFFGGNGLGTLERQDLFAGDFIVTSSTNKSAVEQFVNEQPVSSIDAFNESSRPEISSGSLTDFYFTSGSNPGILVPGFNQALKSKTHIRVSLPVNVNVQMPGSTSSIYYYNRDFGCWNVPQKTTYITNVTGTIPPSHPQPRSSTIVKESDGEAYNAGGDWSDPKLGWAASGPGDSGIPINEDMRGFGPYGNVVVSGSNAISAAAVDQTDVEIYSSRPYDPKTVSRAVDREYPKSVRNNPEYQPTANETFTIPISAPFLLEKAVFEIPMTAGPGWFNDNTQCFHPVTSQTIDAAGPALTVALFRKVRLGKTVGDASALTQLDLIVTGTIIPSGDDIASLTMRSMPPDRSALEFIMTPIGFRVAGGLASAVVQPNASSYFTGSVAAKTTALNATGAMLLHFNSVLFDDFSQVNEIKSLVKSPTIDMFDPTFGVHGSNANQSLHVTHAAPLGRAGTRLELSGRSALGKELASLQNHFDPTGQYARNPYYLGAQGLDTPGTNGAQISETLAAFEAAIAGLTNPTIEFIAPISLISHMPCPYLLMPGDELVLSISKMRPFMYSGHNISPWLSGSMVEHDVGLITGSINITMFGSLVKQNSEYHDPPTQPYGSNVVHEVIGNEPVLDQFDVACDQEFSGSMITDIFNLEKTIQYLHYGARSFRGGALTLSSSYGTNRYHGHMSTRGNEDRQPISQELFWTKSRKIFEFKKRSRTFNLVSDTETFWDSRIPEASAIIEYISPACQLVAGTGPLGTVIGDWIIFTGRYGDMTFCGTGASGATPSTYNKQGLHDWIMTYPFESKYKNITSTFADKIVDNKIWTTANLSGGGGFAPPGGFSIPLGGLTIEFGETSGSNPAVPAGPGVNRLHGMPRTRTWAGEGDIGLTYGLGLTEFIKFFYGFGDGRSRVDNGHVKFLGVSDFSGFSTGAEVRGWRHGMISAFPIKTSAMFRRDHFGHLRDMLEQRLDTKFFSTERTPSGEVLLGPVQARFVDKTGNTTDPYRTLASNMSTEVTSSLPYFDGLVRNRENPLSTSLTNKSIVVF